MSNFNLAKGLIVCAATAGLAACGGGSTDGSTPNVSSKAAAVSTTTAATIAPGQMVLAYYSGYTGNYTSLTTYYKSFNAVSIDFYNLTAKGAVIGNGDPTPSNAIAFLKSKGIPYYGCISNVDSDWDPAIVTSVSTTYKTTAINNLVAFAVANGMAGINIDFEDVNPSDNTNLGNFMTALSTALHAKGLKLIESIPAFDAADASNSWNAGYNLPVIGKAVDYLQVMTYDENIPGWDPGPVSGSDWMEDDLDYVTSLVPAAKVLNGLPAYGYDWVVSTDAGSMLFWNATAALEAEYKVTPTYQTSTNSVTFNYTVGTGKKAVQHTVWTDNAQSITLKTSLVGDYGLGGTSVYGLGMENASFWAAVTAGMAQ